MKKNRRRITLNRETLRHLNEELGDVAGGTDTGRSQCIRCPTQSCNGTCTHAQPCSWSPCFC
jgi:hypothetical protein